MTSAPATKVGPPEADRRLGIPAWLGGPGGVLLVAGVLTLCMAAPVLLRPGVLLFGSEIVGRHADPFIVVKQFESPRGLGVFTQPATDYVGAVLAALTGDGVIAYNAVVLLSFPLSCLFAYLLALRLSDSRAIAWLTGLAYGFAPYHVAHSAYHPHGAQTQWLPLYLLAIWLSLERTSVARLALLAVSATLVALSNFYYGLIAAILTPVALLAFWLLQRHRGRPRATRHLLVTSTFLAAVAAGGLGYVARFAAPVLSHPAAYSFDRQELALYGARWWSYWMPPVEHPLFGALARNAWERHGLAEVLEQQLTLSWGFIFLAATALAAFALSLRATSGGVDGATPDPAVAPLGPKLDTVPAVAALAGVAFVFSLTPTGKLASLRPSGLVYELLPMFRAYARFGLVVFLATALLAGLGAAWLWRRSAKAKFAAIALVALAAVELAPFPPFRSRDVLPTSAHRWLDDSTGPVRVVDCVSLENRAEHPSFAKFRHDIELPGIIGDCGDPYFGLSLGARGFTHMLIRRHSPLANWLETREPPVGTTRVGDFDDALVFQVVDPPPSPWRIEFTRGFHWREYLGNDSYRWMRGQGRLTLVNQSTAFLTADIELRLLSFPGPRTITVTYDRQPLAELVVDTAPSSFVLPTIAIPPGSHILDLQSLEPAVIADSVLANGDERELSIALRGLKVETEVLEVPQPTSSSPLDR